jgi:hypothetical protein
MPDNTALFRKTVTIQSGDSFSSHVDLGFCRSPTESVDSDDDRYKMQGDARCVGISIPSELAAPADITLQANFLEPDDPDFDSGWEDLFDSNDTECTIKLTSLSAQARKRFVPLFPSALLAVPCLRLRTGSAGSPVIQTAPVSFVLAFRRV